MKLREYLRAADLSQRDFSKITGITTSHLNRIIKGKAKPGKYLATTISKITGGRVKASELVDGTACDDPNAPPKAIPSLGSYREIDNEFISVETHQELAETFNAYRMLKQADNVKNV